MAQVILLDNVVPVEFLVGERPPIDMDQEALMEGLAKVADLINATEWTDDQRDAFKALRKLVFFEGIIKVNGHRLDRPCCDEDDRIFYWESNEFMANADPAVRAHTLFHDCFHIIQYWRNETFAQSDDERVEREVEAIDRQIEVAERLNAHQSYIDFLVAFKGSQERLTERLAEGIQKPDAGGRGMGHDKDRTRPPGHRTQA